MSPRRGERRIRRVQFGLNKRIRSVTFVTINGEFQNCLLAIQHAEFILSRRQTKTICCANEKAHETWQKHRRFWDEALFSLVLHLSHLAEPDDQIYKYKCFILFRHILAQKRWWTVQTRKCLIGCVTFTSIGFGSTTCCSYPIKHFLTLSCRLSSWNLILWRGVRQ